MSLISLLDKTMNHILTRDFKYLFTKYNLDLALSYKHKALGEDRILL